MKTQSTTTILCLLALTLLTGVKMESSVFAQDAAQGDNKRVAASIANEDGERLRKQGTAESLRKAVVKYEEALSLWRLAGNQSGEAETLTSAAQVFNSLGEKQKALDYFQQALLLWKEVGDGKGQAIALSGIGAVHYTMGAHHQALGYLKQSLLLFQSLKDAGGVAKRLNDIGVIYSALGEPQEALKYYQQALPMLRVAGDRGGEASALNNIGAAFRVMGEPQQALAYFKQALSVQRDVGDAREMAITLTNIGALHYRLGDAQQALDYYDQALPLRRKVGAIAGQAITLTNIGAAHLSLGDPQRAMEYLKQSLSLTEGGLSRPEEAQALTVLAAASSALGSKQQALEYLHRALALWRAIGERQGESSALIRMGRIYREQGAPQLASKYLEEALQLVRDIGETGSEAVALADIARVERDLGDLDRALNRIETALNQVETLRARIRAEDLRVSFHRAYTLPRRAEIEAAALRAYGLLIKSNLRQYTGSSELAAAELSRMILGPVAAELGRKRLVIVSDGVLQYVPFGALPNPGAAGARAPKLRPLIVDHEVIYLPSASVLATMRREMRERRQAARTVAVFSDPVFNPDDPRVKQARIDGAKANGDESKTEPDLVRSAKETGLPSFERLIYTRKEAEAIVALAPPEQGFKALDFSASRATVMSTGLDQYRIIHFATHGLLNSRSPELSGIVLSLVDEAGHAQEGFLRAYEIYNLKLNAELVVLSACSTALGKEIKGEGLAGLTRGFMYAGTPRVIASLWNVRDQATAELMKRFYRNMLIGKSSPAAALREAQISMWREPRWAAPYYWAGFVLQGEWN